MRSEQQAKHVVRLSDHVMCMRSQFWMRWEHLKDAPLSIRMVSLSWPGQKRCTFTRQMAVGHALFSRVGGAVPVLPSNANGSSQHARSQNARRDVGCQCFCSLHHTASTFVA